MASHRVLIWIVSALLWLGCSDGAEEGQAGPGAAGAAGAVRSAPIESLTDRVLVLRLGERPEPFNAAELAKPDRITLQSDTDPKYAQPVHPATVGYQKTAVDLRRKPNSVEAIWPLKPVIRYQLFITLPEPLTPGSRYTVRVTRGKAALFEEALAYDADAVSPVIKVNQVGYLTAAKRKYAYLGGHLGSLGPLSLAQVNRFDLIDEATGKPVLNGRPKLRGKNDPISGETIYELDFSAARKPGRYHLKVAHVGRSYSFQIADDPLAELRADTQRFFFHQRCGVAIGRPHTRFVRPAWHGRKTDGFFAKSIVESPLHTTEKRGQFLDVTGGWHDAGDSGKYLPTAAETLHILFAGYELFPEPLGSDATGIPESGNGIPDLLDDIQWELTWLLKMQDPADGGVYHKVNHPNWGSKERDKRYIAEKTTHATASFAAIMAASARVMKKTHPDAAARYLAAARLADGFLAKHPKPAPAGGLKNRAGIGGGEYGDADGDADERAWAAAELFKTTGEAVYHQRFLKAPPRNYGKAHLHWSQTQRFAIWTYLTTDRPGVNKPLQANYRRLVIGSGRRILQSLDRFAYRSPVVELGPKQFYVGYGSDSGSARGLAYPLALAYGLTKDRAFLDALALQFDKQLGTNGLGRSYVTGHGAVRCMMPTHHPSLQDGIADPVPGMKLPGPYNRGKVFANSPLFEAHTDPALPAGLIFFDIPVPPFTEPTLDNQAHQLAALAALSQLKPVKKPPEKEEPVEGKEPVAPKEVE